MLINSTQPKICLSARSLHKVLNFVGCVLVMILYFCLLKYSGKPLTLDIIITIFLAELCRWTNQRRRYRSASRLKGDVPLDMVEKGENRRPSSGVIAAVVGYREDPTLFKTALESYLQTQGCKFLLISIDGDTEEDEEMVDIFRKVCKEESAVIHLEVPFAEIALGMDRDKEGQLSEVEIITRCCYIAREVLDEKGVKMFGDGAITRLCVSQRHMHKKGIMFTSFIMSLVLSDILGIEYLWTSDSDSMVFPDTLTRTMEIFSDANIGGASTALCIHNRNETIITKLGGGVYLNELYLARSITGAVAANDCQSGPCAAFRISAVRDELLGWYKQTVLGHWMVTNEDRHLTTRLLLKGWRVVFASDVLTATETPTTLRRWLLQQVRWTRAVHIESLHRPSVYIMQSPILFLSSLRRQIAALLVPTTVLLYLLTGTILLQGFVVHDLVRRQGLTLVYLILRNPYRPAIKTWLWCLPATAFYYIPLPAIEMWSFLTIFHDSWGTTMRSKKEVARHSRLALRFWEVGFFVLWMGAVGGTIGRYLASVWMLSSYPMVACIFLGAGSAAGLWSIWMVLAE
ncbi:hypothetical protein BDW59DRAFT_180938 [Aspergillus cavernicola]|uniref:Glycosyltransferase 2-like domain-containing protein n=1 Tax=Aspergillus cavernicola TaxID=176166 RepID=A0ABR4IXD8_9EURO